MSRSTFQNYYKYIIIPYQDRIRSIHSINPFIFTLPSTPFHNFLQFPRLETLILENIESRILENLLLQLNSLANLSTLSITPIDDVRNENVLYQRIFCLPVLHYCKVSIKNRLSTRLLPVSNAQYSSIKHLVIDHHCSIDYLNVLLSYLPQLTRLSCNHLTKLTIFQHSHRQPIVLNNLTHLSFKIENFNFRDLELFFTKLSHQLQVFHFSTDYDVTYLDANRWEQLILTKMSHLRIFDIQLISKDILNQLASYVSIEQFMTSFWFKRNWFFRYEYEPSFAAFYSIKPCR